MLNLAFEDLTHENSLNGQNDAESNIQNSESIDSRIMFPIHGKIQIKFDDTHLCYRIFASQPTIEIKLAYHCIKEPRENQI